MIGSNEASEIESFSGVVTIATAMSIMFHRELEYLLCSIIVVAYFAGRSFFWFVDRMRYVRFILLVISVFGFIQIIKRQFMRQSR